MTGLHMRFILISITVAWTLSGQIAFAEDDVQSEPAGEQTTPPELSDVPEPRMPDAHPTTEPSEPPPRGDKVIDKSLLDDVTLKAPSTPATWRYAAGVNFAWSIRKDYGARMFRRFEPEVIGFIYTQLPFDRLWLRHGARIGYSNDQPQMPKALRLEESDWKASIEEGIIYSWYVAPSLTAGIGQDWRTIKVKTKSPVLSSDNRLNTKDSFFWYYLQAGVGIPALQGEYLLEPIIRWQHLRNDQRTNWALGLELTKAW